MKHVTHPRSSRSSWRSPPQTGQARKYHFMVRNPLPRIPPRQEASGTIGAGTYIYAGKQKKFPDFG